MMDKRELILNELQTQTRLLSNEAEKAKLAKRRKIELEKSCQAVLSKLLEQIKPVDFRSILSMEGDSKITRKSYVTVAIDEVLKTAIVNNWGLCTKDGFIYVFNGEYWKVITPEDFKPFLAHAAIKMGAPEFECKYYQFKDELYKQFISVSNLPTPDFKDEVLINLLNGTYEVSEYGHKIREFRREDFIKYQLSFEFDKDAQCPIFNNYLMRVLPDDGCRKVLAEYMGYIFVLNLKLEKALILYGSGANGKSVFFEIINALLGDENICSYSLQSLTKYDSYQRAELSNKLLNYASEINGKLESSIFKQLVSGEKVEARQIYGKPFNMENYAKLMFNCNELPKEVEQTDAFFRRFLIIPFLETIPESEQDPELAKKIIANELSGVFNWILTGLSRIIEQRRFTQSEIIKQQVSNYRVENDSVAMFMEEEGYIKDDEETILLKTLYSEYKQYCIDNGYICCSMKTVSSRLKRTGYLTKKTMNGVTIFTKRSC